MLNSVFVLVRNVVKVVLGWNGVGVVEVVWEFLMMSVLLGSCVYIWLRLRVVRFGCLVCRCLWSVEVFVELVKCL